MGFSLVYDRLDLRFRVVLVVCFVLIGVIVEEVRVLWVKNVIWCLLLKVMG